MQLKLIACEILYREFCAAVARSVHQVDVEFLPKGLHDIGQTGMSARLTEAVEAVDESRYDAILLGYGLCSNGVVGLRAKTIPLVIPRAHDCITLFLGDRHRYLDYFHAHPGVYFKTSGWIERGAGLTQFGLDAIDRNAGLGQTLDGLVARYGEDNGRFLFEQLGNLTRNYTGLAFIAMGVEPDDRFERQARQEAADHGWTFETLQGSMALVQQLVDGCWDAERFLVVPPGGRVAASFDAQIVRGEVEERVGGISRHFSGEKTS
ncbi:MAG: DUF1638 domain-containing protein [Planctomycetaceae bacterium]|nr:DUF1638 domain-containing protein [Planctomycetaceae bacterium]